MPTTAEQSTQEQPVVEEHVDERERDELEEGHVFNATASIPADDGPVEVDSHTEEQLKVLSKLPAIYRENLRRRQDSGTAMARRRKSIFLSFLREVKKTPSDKYRKMVLGPLPHLLACLEVLYSRLLDYKNKIKRIRPNYADLEELENGRTSTK